MKTRVTLTLLYLGVVGLFISLIIEKKKYARIADAYASSVWCIIAVQEELIKRGYSSDNSIVKFAEKARKDAVVFLITNKVKSHNASVTATYKAEELIMSEGLSSNEKQLIKDYLLEQRTK